MGKNSNAKQPGTYSVGYGKPPAHTRFQKGSSGNPQGRPKGSLNFASVLLRTLREKVIIQENGKRRVITKLEASMKQLVNKATSGDLRALCLLVGITREAEQRDEQHIESNAGGRLTRSRSDSTFLYAAGLNCGVMFRTFDA